MLGIRHLSLTSHIALMALSSLTAGESAYYTPERIQTGAENLRDYEWARQLWKKIQRGDGTPDYFLGRTYGNIELFGTQSDDFLWHLQPDTVIPRYIPAATGEISPITGRKLSQQHGFKAWLVDPIRHPFQVQDRSTGEWFPKNDFAAYYRHGLNAEGRFDAALADRTFPEGLRNLEDGSNKFVDRGNGEGFPATPDNPTTPAVEKETFRIYPVRLYAKFVYTAYTMPLLRSFSQSALLETDPAKKAAAARKGLILLARLAFIFPDYRPPAPGEIDRRPWTSRSAITGVSGPAGMITDRIWENFSFEAICMAYDALRPFIDKDPTLIEFLQSKGMPVANAAELDSYIRHHLLQAGMHALLTHKIKGNLGMHQRAALAAAVAYDDPTGPEPNTRSMVDFIYSGPEDAHYILNNSLLRDGGGHESVNYNRFKLDLIQADRLMTVLRARYPKEFSSYPDILAGEKARSLFDYFIDVAPQDRFVPDFGDSGSLEKPKTIDKAGYLPSAEFYYAWEKFDRDRAQPGAPSRYLRAAGISGEWPAGEIFAPFPNEEARQANAASQKNEALPYPRLLEGYGVGFLEQGQGDRRRTVLLNGSALMGHRQYDPLSLNLYAYNLSLLPDLGYPQTWNYRFQFDGHSLAANTVTVDETRGTMGSLISDGGGTKGTGPTGTLWRLFAQAEQLQVSAVSFDPYPPGFASEPFRQRFEKAVDAAKVAAAAKGVTLYERVDALIEIDENCSYVVDLFSVNGGSQHDQSWHGPLAPLTDPPLDWKTQPEGTLAGPTIKRFSTYTDSWGRENLGGAFPSYLAAIRRAPLTAPGTWEWRESLPSKLGFRLHVLPTAGGLEAIRGEGRSPARSAELDYLILRRKVSEGERSSFLTLLEPFSGEPFLKEVRLISESPLIVEVNHPLGRDRITFTIPDGGTRTTATRPLAVRLQRWLSTEEAPSIDVSIGETYREAAITEVDYERRSITLPHSEELAAACETGRTVRIFNDKRSSLYRIVDRHIANDKIELILDHTALLAQGPVRKVEPNRLELRANIRFANGRVDAAGTLILDPWQSRDFLDGAVIGEGALARRLRGGAQTGSEEDNLAQSFVYFEKPEEDPSVLASAWQDRTTNIWDYGAGDTLEIPTITKSDRAPIPSQP